MDRLLARVDIRLLRFIVVGSSNFVLGMLLFQAAWLAGDSLGGLRTPIAQAITYAIGMAWSFFWNRKWVFRPPNSPAARVGSEAFRFAVVQVLCLLLSIALVTAAIDGIGMAPLLGWLAAMMPLVLLNFYLISRWVFPAGDICSPAHPARPTKKVELS